MKNNDNDNFLISLACSIAFHLLVLYLFLAGFPSIFHPLPSDEQIITFEALPISSISNIPNKSADKKEKIEKPADARKVQASKTETVEKSQPEEIKPEKNIPEPQIDKAEVIPDKKKETPKSPKKEPQKQTKEINKSKEKVKNQKNMQSDDLESLLKNLEKASKGENAKSNKRDHSSNADTQESKGSFNENLPLSITEKALIKQQLEKNWKLPIGAQNIDQIKVRVYIALNRDGSIAEVKVTDKICNGVSNNLCDLFVDSCIRAVWQSSPIQNLSEERYITWKALNFEFDPTYMTK